MTELKATQDAVGAMLRLSERLSETKRRLAVLEGPLRNLQATKSAPPSEVATMRERVLVAIGMK